MSDTNEPIGYLIACQGVQGVCCAACRDAATLFPPNKPIPLHRVNVEPYRQTCHGCGKTLVEGRTSLWPELFAKAAK